MGVNLSGLVEPQAVDLSYLRGRTVAIDAYNMIYQFLSTIRQPDGSPLCDREGRVTSHLSGILYRTSNFIEQGIEPVFVFDGKPDALKTATLDERRDRREQAVIEWEEAKEAGDMERAFSKAQQTSRMTAEIRASSEALLDAMGLPRVDAPADGEAQAAYMCMKGSVYAAASQDFDSLLFGTPLLVRNMTITGRRKIPGKNVYRDVTPELISSEEFLGSLGISREQLVDMCILIGTDFNPGIRGIGPKKGLKYIKEFGDLEHVLPHIGKEIPDYEEIRAIFLDGPHSDDYSTEAAEPDREAVIELMTAYDFSPERVTGTLERIETARKKEREGRKQRSLDNWF